MRRLLLLALLTALALPAAAQDWPTRPVRLIVPFPPGGGTDAVARVVAQRLAEGIGQPVVVENRGGAGGVIGSEAVARATADGHTLGIATSSTHPAAVVLRREMPYDPVRDFTAVTMIGVTPYVLVGGAGARGTTLAEFLADVRARPGAVTYASVGTSTLGYLLTRHFENLTGTAMTHVPYRGSAAVYPDLLNGTVAVLLDNPTGSAGLVQDGRLRAYAITRRSPLLPQVPTFAEAGVPDFEAAFWYGLVAPPGTPPAIASRIQAVLARHFLGAGRAELTAKDVEPVFDAPAAFARTIAADIIAFRAVAERIGLQPE